MDLISVIIPYYKKKEYIASSINSVLKQSYKNLELIIIYDDSNLDDLIVLNNIKKKDKRIKIFINKKNLGAGLSRNKGIKLSKGNFIAFLDSDDLWSPNKLKKQIFFMKQGKQFLVALVLLHNIHISSFFIKAPLSAQLILFIALLLKAL